MEIFKELMPYAVAVLSSTIAWLAGRRKAKAEAIAIDADNVKKLLETNEEFIVQPIKKEINVLRREVHKLEKSIEHIKDCAHANNCPVRVELQKLERTDPNQL